MKHKLRFTLLLLLSLNIHSQQWINKGVSITYETFHRDATYLSADGNTLAVGNNGLDIAQVFTWDGANWIQKGGDILPPPTGVNNGDFGAVIALSDDGDILAISDNSADTNGTTSGYVQVYYWDGNVWNFMGNRIDGEASGDTSGRSTLGMSSDGLSIIIGSWLNDDYRTNAGHVRIFNWDTNTNSWLQKGQPITGRYRNGAAGEHVSMNADGNTIAFSDPTNDAGEVYIYTWNNTLNIWEQKGNTIFGDNGDGWLGTSVSLSDNGNTIAFGAPRANNFTGLAKVYQWNNTTEDWEQKGSTFNGDVEDSYYGREITINSDGSTLIVSAYKLDIIDENNSENDINDTGVVKVYEWNGSDWTQKGQSIFGAEASSRLGEYSLSLSHDGETISFHGRYQGEKKVYVYQFDENLSQNDQKRELLKLYPNPIKDVLYIDKKLSNCTLQLFSLDGKLVYDKFLKNTSIPIQLEYLQPGIYIAKLKTNEQTFSQKLIKE